MRVTYRPSSQNRPYFFGNIDKGLYVCSNYEKFVLAGDFNKEVVEKWFHTSLYQQELIFVNNNTRVTKTQVTLLDRSCLNK